MTWTMFSQHCILIRVGVLTLTWGGGEYVQIG